MKILVTGDKAWNDIDTIVKAFMLHAGQNVTIVEGECTGADIMCRAVAEELCFDVKKYPAIWRNEHDGYRHWAGVERNQRMLDDNPDIDVCYAFHNNIFSSKGTKDMLKRVIKKGVPWKLWTTNELAIEQLLDVQWFCSK